MKKIYNNSKISKEKEKYGTHNMTTVQQNLIKKGVNRDKFQRP